MTNEPYRNTFTVVQRVTIDSILFQTECGVTSNPIQFPVLIPISTNRAAGTHVKEYHVINTIEK